MENKQKLSRLEEICLIEEYLKPVGESLLRNEIVQAKIKFKCLSHLVQTLKEQNQENEIKEEPEDLPDLEESLEEYNIDNLPSLIPDQYEEGNEAKRETAHISESDVTAKSDLSFLEESDDAEPVGDPTSADLDSENEEQNDTASEDEDVNDLLQQKNKKNTQKIRKTKVLKKKNQQKIMRNPI